MSLDKPRARWWTTYWFESLLIFLFATLLIWPLYKIKYTTGWHSIESTFIADARFLNEQWPHPRWQPLWYCGTRFDYVYPPALRYGTAILAKAFPILPVRAYHIYSALFYCFGIAGVYVFTRALSRNRGLAALAAVATALVAPSFLFLPNLRHDAPYWIPSRLGVLIRYGEGPHMTALAWIPVALAFSYKALIRLRAHWWVLSSVAMAMVVSNNFYGANSLAILFPMLAWGLYVTRLDFFVWFRAVAIVVLAYGLTAFWLVPSYLQITLENMRFVSSEGNMWSRWATLFTVVLFLLLSNHYARGRQDRIFEVFSGGALAFFALNVLGNHYLNFRVLGEPSRMAPELDLAFIFVIVAFIGFLWKASGRWKIAGRTAAVLGTMVLLAPGVRYASRAWVHYQPDLGFRDTVEYRLQDWMAKNQPTARTMAAGSVRFWYNVWNDLPQLGGGSDQGQSNPISYPAQIQILQGRDVEMSTLWMQVLGTDAIIVNFPNSREHYHDYAAPDQFKDTLPVLHDDGEGNIIYRVPRRYPAHARVVDRAKLNSMRGVGWQEDREGLRAHREMLESGPEAPVDMQWEGTDAFRVKTRIAEAQSLVVQVSYDSSWRAETDGKPLLLSKDHLGFIRADPPPGDHEIRFHFAVPTSNKIGRVVTLLCLCFVIYGISAGLRRREAIS